MTDLKITQENLLAEMVRCGLIQFGYFQHTPDEYWPITFHLSMLPSFPAILAGVAQCIAPSLPVQSARDRLLTMPDTVALGAVIVTATGMPMLYPRREAVKDYTAAFAIEGTADVGNPTTLLTDVLLDGQKEAEIMTISERVGIPVQGVFAIVDTQRDANRHFAKVLPHPVSITSLFTIHDLVDWMATSGKFPAPLVQTVRTWANLPDQSSY